MASEAILWLLGSALIIQVFNEKEPLNLLPALRSRTAQDEAWFQDSSRNCVQCTAEMRNFSFPAQNFLLTSSKSKTQHLVTFYYLIEKFYYLILLIQKPVRPNTCSRRNDDNGMKEMAKQHQSPSTKTTHIMGNTPGLCSLCVCRVRELESLF